MSVIDLVPYIEKTKKNVIHKKNYREAAKIFKNKLLSAKKDYSLDQLNKHKNDSKKFWKQLYNLLPCKDKPKFNSIYNNNGELLHEEAALDFVNQFFSSIGDRIEGAIDDLPTPTTPPLVNENFSFDIGINCFNPDNVASVVKDINTNKASGISDLNTSFLKNVFSIIPFVLSDFYVHSFTSGCLPDDWKTGSISVIPKKGSTLFIDNIRPITQTNLLVKIFEKLINKELMDFLENNNILHPNQGGFRRNRSTVDTVSSLINYISNSKNNREYSMAIFLDLSKAFDSVNHSLLLGKLERVGIKGNLFRWLKCYLTNRNQCVKNTTLCSSFKPVNSGVPQGSVLGPTLFLLYINDLKFLDLSVEVNLFADDTVLYFSHQNLNSLLDTMQNNLNKVSNWCSYSKLLLNHKKTNCIIFSPSFSKHLDTTSIKKIQLFGNEINYVSDCDYLGINIDFKLNFDKFFSKLKTSVLHKINMLGRIRKFLTKDAATIIFKSMALPYFEYGSIFLEILNQKQLDKLDRIFLRGIRIATNNYLNLPPRSLYDSINILPLQYRRFTAINKLIFKKIERKEIPMSNPNTNITTRLQSGPVIEWPDVSHNKFKKFLPHLGASLWNSLPSNIRNLKDPLKFTNELKKYYKSVYNQNEIFDII